MNQILSRIFPSDIYDGFTPMAESVTGWGGDDTIFGDFIRSLRPKVIIEVGSWKGQSAITMADACKTNRLDAAIICVDTWLGSAEHVLTARKELMPVHGYPTLYYQFLSNVIHRGVRELIVPFPATSTTAATVLRKLGIKADLIYVDGDHQYESVSADLSAFTSLLVDGGTIFGHDHDWPSVHKAVKSFCKRTGYHCIRQSNFWILNTAWAQS